MEKKNVTELLHSDFLVELRNGERRILTKVGNGTRILQNPVTGAWNYLSRWEADGKVRYHIDLALGESGLAFKKCDIVKVWGRVTGTVNYVHASNPYEDAGRALLWQRSEPVKMTVAQIIEKLGYDIEIVADEEVAVYDGGEA